LNEGAEAASREGAGVSTLKEGPEACAVPIRTAANNRRHEEKRNFFMKIHAVRKKDFRKA
jgi:hypothetical protein